MNTDLKNKKPCLSTTTTTPVATTAMPTVAAVQPGVMISKFRKRPRPTGSKSRSKKPRNSFNDLVDSDPAATTSGNNNKNSNSNSSRPAAVLLHATTARAKQIAQRHGDDDDVVVVDNAQRNRLRESYDNTGLLKNNDNNNEDAIDRDDKKRTVAINNDSVLGTETVNNMSNNNHNNSKVNVDPISSSSLRNNNNHIITTGNTSSSSNINDADILVNNNNKDSINTNPLSLLSNGNKKRRKAFGPVRAPAHLRATIRMDYQPDVCKDYKETGYCGFGDACKFLHDRSDYKAGWQLDEEWTNRQRSKHSGGSSISVDDDDDDGLPFACFICRKDFESPVMTLCEHFFCEQCALQQMQRKGSCAVCGKQMRGTLNAAPKLIAKLNKRKT